MLTRNAVRGLGARIGTCPIATHSALDRRRAWWRCPALEACTAWRCLRDGRCARGRNPIPTVRHHRHHPSLHARHTHRRFRGSTGTGSPFLPTWIAGLGKPTGTHRRHCPALWYVTMPQVPHQPSYWNSFRSTMPASFPSDPANEEARGTDASGALPGSLAGDTLCTWPLRHEYPRTFLWAIVPFSSVCTPNSFRRPAHTTSYAHQPVSWCCESREAALRCGHGWPDALAHTPCSPTTDTQGSSRRSS
jgi:hypothetical protein